ncbi:hypothetical protein [Paenibacillus terrigena]|uniref:hypothetical protein n=1 Tax=Paenibacillus terrigena TaxID=369333 RepID=UPI0028D57B3F|nr:hypothetical protein [Paenibacillus terrigena]
MDMEKKALKKAEMVFETTDVLTENVYKITPEEKEKLDRLAEDRIDKARNEAIPKIRERYEQRVKDIRQQQQAKDG